jgi:hypothetical protein
MVELVDTVDLGSAGCGLEGSSPSVRIHFFVVAAAGLSSAVSLNKNDVYF